MTKSLKQDFLKRSKEIANNKKIEIRKKKEAKKYSKEVKALLFSSEFLKDVKEAKVTFESQGLKVTVNKGVQNDQYFNTFSYIFAIEDNNGELNMVRETTVLSINQSDSVSISLDRCIEEDEYVDEEPENFFSFSKKFTKKDYKKIQKLFIEDIYRKAKGLLI